jgi:hypothetical protein
MTPETKARIERIAKWKMDICLFGSASISKDDFDWYMTHIGAFDGARMSDGMLRGDDLKGE